MHKKIKNLLLIMNKKNIFMCCLWQALLVAASGSAQDRAPNPSGVQVSVLYPETPLFKGSELNPVLQVKIFIPAGKQMNLRSIQLQMDQQAQKNIEKIDVFTRDEKQKGFTRVSILATVNHWSFQTNIPVDVALKAGLNYFWLNAVLKANADPDKKIMLRVNSIISANGSIHKPLRSVGSTGNSGVFTRRIGITLRKAWDDSVHTYRIPGMATTGKGTLIAVYDVRYKSSGDLPGNIDVGMSRSADGGRTWEPMKIIMDMGPPHENNGCGDPSVLFDPVTKKLWVAALWSKGNRSIAGSEPGFSPDSTGQFVLISSDDDGLTWSAPYSITSQVKNPAWHVFFNGPGNGIAMKNGTLVFPSQYWDESKKPGIPHSSIIYSEDHGKTWKSGTGAKYNTTESQVVETSPGVLMLNMRDNRGRYRSIATTSDMGKTWIEHPTSYEALPDPVCMASFIKAKVNVKGKIKDVLFFGNVASQSGRQNTTIKASLDLGESWVKANQVLLDSRTTYGYSALTKIDDHTIGILYEGERDLYFLRIPVNEIIK